MPLFGPHRTYDWNFLRGFVLPSRSRDNHQSAGIDSRLAASAVTCSTVELEGLAVNKKLTIQSDSFGLARPPGIVGRQQWNCLSSQHSASETSASGESCTSFRCDQKPRPRNCSAARCNRHRRQREASRRSQWTSGPYDRGDACGKAVALPAHSTGWRPSRGGHDSLSQFCAGRVTLSAFTL